jgi:microcystin-dependent protein
MGFLEDLKNGDIKSIIIVIFGVLIFNIYWCNKNSESMADVASLTEDKIKELIYKTYLIDVTAIKNLSDVANKLQAGGLTIPGDLTVSGNLNLLPRGTIVAYNQNTAPTGWTLCDGSNGSPDLRNRFILGWGNRGITATGGEENVTLTQAQMPSHNHVANVSDPGHQHHMIEGMGIVHGGRQWYARDGGWGGAHPRTNNTTTGVTVSIGHTGSNQSHNNMPPFYVLTYIMKL